MARDRGKVRNGGPAQPTTSNTTIGVSRKRTAAKPRSAAAPPGDSAGDAPARAAYGQIVFASVSSGSRDQPQHSNSQDGSVACAGDGQAGNAERGTTSRPCQPRAEANAWPAALGSQQQLECPDVDVGTTECDQQAFQDVQETGAGCSQHELSCSPATVVLDLATQDADDAEGEGMPLS